MSNLPIILGLDVASTTGWACGRPGDLPVSGTVRFAPAGSSHGKVGVEVMKWLRDIYAAYNFDMVYYEAPFDPRKMGMKTTMATSRMLLGIPFLLETLLYAKEVYRVREMTVSDVRKHFLGGINPRGDAGKLAVQTRCRQIGWHFNSPDAADALAVWDAACYAEFPEVKQAIDKSLEIPF